VIDSNTGSVPKPLGNVKGTTGQRRSAGLPPYTYPKTGKREYPEFPSKR